MLNKKNTISTFYELTKVTSCRLELEPLFFYEAGDITKKGWSWDFSSSGSS
jgi:hypothetical protein